MPTEDRDRMWLFDIWDTWADEQPEDVLLALTPDELARQAVYCDADTALIPAEQRRWIARAWLGCQPWP